MVATFSARFSENDAYDTKALIKAMVLSDEFNVSHTETAVGAEEIVGIKKVRPGQAQRMVEALTGFLWRTDIDIDFRNGGRYGETVLTEDSMFGYRVLAGGIDAASVAFPAHAYNAPTAAFWSAFAAQIAAHVVSHDFAPGAIHRRLLDAVDPDTVDEGAIRAQLATLHARLHAQSVAADSAVVDETYALFEAIRQQDGLVRAWTITLNALFQDARFTHY